MRSTLSRSTELGSIISSIAGQVNRAIDSLTESGVHARSEAIIAWKRADQIVGAVEDWLTSCGVSPADRDRVNWPLIVELGLDRLDLALNNVDDDWFDHLNQ